MSSRATRAFRILICDDEPAVLRALGVALESHGYAITATDTGEQAVARAASDAPDLILLDLGLPGIDGRETIRRIRAFLPDTPIIVLSAWAEDETKVEALDLGADDYIEKPFAMPELLARIRVAVRHLQRGAGSSVEASRLERGDITLDLAERRVLVRGRDVPLTRTQFDLLAAFARHPGRVLTHRTLVSEVWGDPDATDPSNLRVFISQLRRSIEREPEHPERIQTAAGVGYRFIPGCDDAGSSRNTPTTPS
jgi:two-component system, OmpR family, KDP operon response regulator KdpE